MDYISLYKLNWIIDFFVFLKDTVSSRLRPTKYWLWLRNNAFKDAEQLERKNKLAWLWLMIVLPSEGGVEGAHGLVVPTLVPVKQLKFQVPGCYEETLLVT